ncbi:MAG: HEAT repeat domain-containing protein [Planctomycetaceae bacterium]|jgi:HEAT repeat protein|nr:HEAT repeat domain-containing protein [Planctomycetaceae bacterium]
MRIFFTSSLLLVFLVLSCADVSGNPFDDELQGKVSALLRRSSNVEKRARAAEALGYMRAYKAEDVLIEALEDDAAEVRRNAVLALAWCGSRAALKPLLQRLDDSDWTVRQSAAIALENLTGANIHFNALDQTVARKQSETLWKNYLEALPVNKIPDETKKLIASKNHRDATRALRAAGTFGTNPEIVQLIAETLEPWRKNSNENNTDAKIRVQSALRVLGRSGLPEALPVLKDFLYNKQWTRYAADALGDLCDNNKTDNKTNAASELMFQVASALMDVFPSHSRQINDKILAGENIIRAKETHPSDIPHLDARDRILAAPYAILFSLSRIPFDDPQLLDRLKQLAPLIAQQIPLDIDRLVFYEEEPFQKIFRSLLIRAGEKENLLEHAFKSLENSMPNATKTSTSITSINKETSSNIRFADSNIRPVQSPILHGGDEPFRVVCDVNGWSDLYLVVDSVENYSMDRANWAEAKLTDVAGETVYLDTLKPVSVAQEHDSIKQNSSANYPDIRIGTKRFPRGLHTHAFSVIHYKLDGKYSQFSAETGVCSSRKEGQGSVRFFVSPVSVAQKLPTLPFNSSFNSNLLLTLCRESSELPRIIPLLDHPNHWVRINVAKTLLFIGDNRAVPPVRERLAASKREADYGEFAPPPYKISAQGQDEFDDPTPRYREAFIMLLGGFRDVESVPLLVRILNDDKNSLGIRHRAGLALDKIGSAEALEALREAELNHQFHSVRTAAREALWRHNISPLPRPPVPNVVAPVVDQAEIPQRATRFVFVKGSIVPPNNPFQMDSWRQAYATTDSGPTYRPGDNLYTLDIAGGEPVVRRLTNFSDGYVADCEVSFDGKTVWFARREQTSAWWHIFRVQADGSNLRQVTFGNNHDVQPVELPNGRIAFSSTRLGTRDEYHGYPATGLTTMTPDGKDIQVVGFNFGRDSEPSVADDGSVLITRLELFYSRMKTEYNLLALRPDGTQARTIYGPERRAFWRKIHGGYGGWFAGGEEGGRHRLLRLTQPQPFSADKILLTTPAGPVLTQGRQGEQLLRQPFLREGGNDEMVITTAIRLDERTLLVAAGKKNKVKENSQFPKDGVTLGIYTMDVLTGELVLLYRDESASCYEARPLHARIVPPVISDDPSVRGSSFTGLIYAQSVFHTQESRTRELGKLLRVVEGLPQVTRHATHTIPGEYAWKNHGGAFGRDLGTVPLASDGSFAVEVPADRFIALQVLDGDRNVVGNQLIWMNVRPGENKGCIGCHEPADTAIPPKLSQAFRAKRPTILPSGETFNFHAKVWFKGHLPEEREERQRTTQSANWFARP